MDINQLCAAKVRALRLRHGWTLDECERRSGGEFKSVVLGAYERGTRAISLARLQRLAEFYEVSMAYFFSHSQDIEPADRWIIDIRALRKAITIEPTRDLISLQSALAMIATDRGDWAGEFLTVRGSDRRLVLSMINNDIYNFEEELAQRKIIMRN